MCRNSVRRLIGLGRALFFMTCLFMTGQAGTDVLAQNIKAGSLSPRVMDHPAFAASQVVLVTASGRHQLTVEVASSVAQRRLGLMNRPRMDANAGMLFDFGKPRLVAMWMKNTLIPLDMIFIAANGRIIRIAENTKPYSLTAIRSGGKARAVLEINAGSAARLGLKTGDRVEHDIFGKRHD